MGVEGGVKCVKYLLFFFNFIFWLCGILLIIVGLLVQVTLHKTVLIKDAAASGGPILIIIAGVVIFLITFFGCCGACKENYCMVTTFSVLLVLIILLEIAAVIVGYIFINKSTNIVPDSLNEMINDYNKTAEFKKIVDGMQERLKCCGVNSSADWKHFRPDGNSVPDSCCVNVTTNCGIGAMTDAAKVYQKGCRSPVEALLKKITLWVVVAAIVIAFLQIMGIVLSCVLMKGIRSGYEVM
ncbi:hypothetical protein PAMA_021383 [Pampus argenteus]